MSDFDEAIARLRAGRLVAMPTETVYGLAADACSIEGVNRIYEAKGRPRNHPLIVHLSGAEQMSEWATDVPELAYQLADQFWPGPLTLILKKHPRVIGQVTGHQDTIALRVPKHPVAQELLRQFGGGLAAPSANRFGGVSPTTAAHVEEEFGEQDVLILDGGMCTIGIESTILNLSGGKPQILRPGLYMSAQLSSLLGGHITCLSMTGHEQLPRVPGAQASHYSPRAAVWLFSGRFQMNWLEQCSGLAKVAVMSFFARPEALKGLDKHIIWVVMDSDSQAYARSLYAVLRELDQKHCSQILIESPPLDEQWSGVNDRLSRSSKGVI